MQKDIRNHPLWNPTNDLLHNIEQDEAGKLAKFRDRFGRGWDQDSPKTVTDQEGNDTTESVVGKEAEEGDNLLDLIGNYATENSAALMSADEKAKLIADAKNKPVNPEEARLEKLRLAQKKREKALKEQGW
jgi:hypothetical protein